MPIECLIFDCDGTLVDSEKLGNQVVAEIFAEHGVTLDLGDLQRDYRGVFLTDMFSGLAELHGVKLADDVIDDYRRRLRLILPEQLEPIPGIHSVLESLPLPKCVATSAPQDKLRLCLQVTKLRPYFGDNLFSAYDIQVWKPEPDLFLHAANKMGFAPEQCVVIEDSPVGVAAGIAAGMTTIHFNHNGEYEMVSESVAVMEQMEELPALLAIKDS